ncbi:hypothetical protein LTR28_009821 [Elasticomyces elasticus]|nr:hypothetical protein LTR28_009821 [Elasticomyces elasticus]
MQQATVAYAHGSMAPETGHPQPNGLLHDGERIEKLLDEVLCIRDDVFDGTHPRIKLQKAAIEQLTKRQITNADAIAHNHSQGHAPPVNGVGGRAQEPPFANGMTNAFSNSSAVTLARDEPLLARLPKMVPGDATAAPPLANSFPRANDKPPSSSDIDPIFLTKSDSLVRAETQLARQRRERELDAALHKRRNASHGQGSGLEPDPLSGLGNILNTALELVFHLSQSVILPPASRSTRTRITLVKPMNGHQKRAHTIPGLPKLRLSLLKCQAVPA